MFSVSARLRFGFTIPFNYPISLTFIYYAIETQRNIFIQTKIAQSMEQATRRHDHIVAGFKLTWYELVSIISMASEVNYCLCRDVLEVFICYGSLVALMYINRNTEANK